jgi:hypothetical protein
MHGVALGLAEVVNLMLQLGVGVLERGELVFGGVGTAALRFKRLLAYGELVLDALELSSSFVCGASLVFKIVDALLEGGGVGV